VDVNTRLAGEPKSWLCVGQNSGLWPSPHYLPLDYVRCGKHLLIHCIRGPADKPGDAFISDTERRQQQCGENHILLPLERFANAKHNATICGLLFHSGRCGSTLLCNMLDTLSDCFVVRESEIINALLNDKSISTGEKTQLLYMVLALYSRYASRLGCQCVIKFTSHCALHIAYLLNSLPDIPWIYLYRDPAATIASFTQKPPPWLSSNYIARILSLSNEHVPESAADQTALMLYRSFQHIAEQYASSKISKVFSYNKLLTSPAAEAVSHHFGFHVTPEEAAAMAECLTVDAKTGEKRRGTTSQLEHQKKDGDADQISLAAKRACAALTWKNYEYLCQNT